VSALLGERVHAAGAAQQHDLCAPCIDTSSCEFGELGFAQHWHG
jgi:hypothetical protein